MPARFYRSSDGNAVGLDELLSDYIAANGGRVEISGMVEHIEARERAGEIEMRPTGDELRRMVLISTIQAWTSRTSHERGARFVNNRAGRRFDRRAGQIAAQLDIERRQYVASITEFMLRQGPAAYRSQAITLFEIDPSANADRLARDASRKVREAILDAHDEVQERRGGRDDQIA